LVTFHALTVVPGVRFPVGEHMFFFVLCWNVVESFLFSGNLKQIFSSSVGVICMS
jgi:hypothetical protein